MIRPAALWRVFVAMVLGSVVFPLLSIRVIEEVEAHQFAQRPIPPGGPALWIYVDVLTFKYRQMNGNCPLLYSQRWPRILRDFHASGVRIE